MRNQEREAKKTARVEAADRVAKHRTKWCALMLDAGNVTSRGEVDVRKYKGAPKEVGPVYSSKGN